MKIERLVNALFKKDSKPYYSYINSRFKNKKNSLYRYVPIDLRELKDVKDMSIEDIKKVLQKDYQYSINALLGEYMYHNSPKFFNDPFDCVFGVGFSSLFRELILYMVDRDQIRETDQVLDNIPDGVSLENINEETDKLAVSHSIKNLLKTSSDIGKLMMESGIGFDENPDLAQKVFMKHMFDNPKVLHDMLTPFVQKNLSQAEFGKILKEGRKKYINDELPLIDLLNPDIEEYRKLAKSDKEKTEFKNMESKLHDTITELNNKIFDLIDDKFGIIALTSLENDPLMWAHYADSHRGFCIEYDFTDYMTKKTEVQSLVFPVEYSKQRVSIDENVFDKVDLVNFDDKGKEDITRLFVSGLFTKHISWKKENEWRSIAVLKDQSLDNRKIPAFKVKSISLGNKMNHKIRQAVYELINDSENSDIEFFEMINELENFDIIRKKY